MLFSIFRCRNKINLVHRDLDNVGSSLKSESGLRCDRVVNINIRRRVGRKPLRHGKMGSGGKEREGGV